MKRARGVALALLAVVALVVGVQNLADSTQSRHDRVAPDSEIELVVQASMRREEGGQSLEEMVTGKILACRFQVHSDLQGPIEAVDAHGRFRAVLSPSMDRTDRRQFTGCLQDWSLDHLVMRVVELEVS
ncbi:MAG TPA: hypothetical protein VFN21_10570 [Acidimicrobiales bacterium]|nr:hypothetical protein [Acidimicrobiales bacterium]